jgi:mannose-1-phosphate guanylyltransferase / phosphomannomutase
MAGGEGSRLRPLTILRPKPMVPIVNKPVMEHVLDLLKRSGIDEVVVTVQYLAHVIQDNFGDGSDLGLKIHYSVEETPLGTAGSVKKAEHLLDEPFVVISGDALTDLDLRSIVASHQARRAKATLTLYHVPNPLEYGVVIVDDEGKIRQFLEKPSWGEVFSDTVNTGVYVLDPSIFEYIQKDKVVDFSQDVFPKLLEGGDRLYGHVAEGYWTDVGNIQEYMRASADLLEGKVSVDPIGVEMGGGVWAEDDSVEISPDAQIYGPVYLGRDVKIKGGVILRGPTVVREHTVIDSGAQVDRSIIWRNSYVGERAEIRGAIVGRQCSVRSKAMIFDGAVVGDNTTIGEGAVIQPGIKIWPDKEVEDGATVTTSLIWGSRGKRTLFGRFGVTGQVNIDMTPEFAARFGAAYGSTLAKGASVVLNRDYDRGARMIKRAIIAGLPAAGISCLDLKSMPIPVVRYVIRATKAAGGVHVRLSPFDRRVVDVRIFDEKGLDIDRRTERKIESIYFREDVRRVYLDEIGLISDQPQLAELYADGFRKSLGEMPNIGQERPLIIDYAHSPAANILSSILNGYRWDVIALGARMDEAAQLRSAEQIEAGIRQLQIITKSLPGRLGFRFDVGGERLSVVDDRAERVGGWQLFGALATLCLKDRLGGKLVVPVSAPSMVERVAQQYGGRVVRTKSDIQSLMAAATDEEAILASDGLGGMIFPHFHPGLDALYSLARLCQLLLRQQVDLSEVVAGLPEFHMTRRMVDCPWAAKGRTMRVLSQKYARPGSRQIDGVKVERGPQEWALVLPDADRPLFHVIVESTAEAGAQALLDEFAKEVQAAQR